MKYKIIAALLAAVLLGGCTDNVQEKVYGTINDSNFWQTEQDFLEGLYSAYGQLYIPYRGFSIFQFVIEDGGADYNASSTPYPEFFTYTNWSSTLPDAIDWGIYKYLWWQISYLNKVLDRLEISQVSEDRRPAIRAEARGLRAFMYFTLTQWFKDVPLVTDSDDQRFSIPREPVEKIYKFVEDELAASLADLPAKEDYIAAQMADYGRITRGAMAGLLARTYLVQKKYTECAAICNNIITRPEYYGAYELMPSYMSVFSTTGYENKEVMWALTGDGVNQGSTLQIYLYKPNSLTKYGSYERWGGNYSVTLDFYNSFDPQDKRMLEGLYYDHNPAMDGNENINRVAVIKYPDATSDGWFSASDFPMIRYADILLMYAESIYLGPAADTENAVIWVNEVRRRSGATEYDAANFTAAGSFTEKIYEERRFEFFFEGCGKRDMLRFGKLRAHIAATSQDAGDNPERYYYLPFPATAIAANPGLVQNDGYK